jgi:hypothetical protein
MNLLFKLTKLQKNIPCLGTALLQTRSYQRTCHRSCGPPNASGSVAAATCRPTGPSMMAPTPACSAASITSGSRWVTRRTTSPPLASSPAPPQRCHRSMTNPGESYPTTLRCPSASASTSFLHHCQWQLTLKPFFQASLPGVWHAQRNHHQAATHTAAAGRPPGSWTTPFSQLAATKKPGVALWALPERAASDPLCITSTPHCKPSLIYKFPKKL